MNQFVSKLGFVLLFVAVFIASCKKDNTNGSEVSLKININFGSQPLAYNQAYDYQGMKLKFETLRFYICDFKFYTKDEVFSYPDSYFIFDVETLSNVITKLPVGNFTKVSFGMGVDAARNTQSGAKAIPAVDYPMDHPLNAVYDMYWGWNPGYIFAKYDGRVDVNSNGIYGEADDVNFSFHPGVNGLFRTIERSVNLESDGQSKTIVMDFDVSKILETIDIVSENFAHPGTENSPEFKLAKNLVDAYNIAFSQVK